MYSRFSIGKHFFLNFLSQEGLKEGESLTLSILNFPLNDHIRRFQEIRVGQK
jgi:hypothetical protein